MNKQLLAFLIIGIMIATAGCGSNTSNGAKKDDVLASNNNVANVLPNNVNSVNAQENSISNVVDIKKEEFIGKTVTVQGNVENNLKTASLSGFRLKDATDSIPISSSILPKVNTTVTVTGIVQKSSYFGIYIVAINK